MFCILVEMRLDEASKMGTEYSSLMARLSRAIVADGRILAQRHTY